jgi:hypothetical protein
VESLVELISREIAHEPARVNSPAARRVEVPTQAKGTETAPHAFEIAVFNFLVAQAQPLGIEAVWQCRNVRIDGLLDLDEGRRLGLEIKYRMNWEKGLVVFETFTGDWARRKPNWLLESGWNFFYMDHHEVEGLRVDLVRFRGQTLESFSTALSAARAKTGAVGDDVAPS